MTTENSRIIGAHVYYTRFDIDHTENREAFERARDIRGGYTDYESIDLDDLYTVYEYMGEADGSDLEDIYNTAQETGESRSMMMGDLIITEDNEVYAVDRWGYKRLEGLEAELNERDEEDRRAEEACARAEIAAEARMEKRLARHADRHGWGNY